MNTLVIEHLLFKQAVLVSVLFVGTCLADDLPKMITNSISMELILIPAGEFMMGSSEEQSDAKPQHLVKISKPFYLGRTETTRPQWQKIMMTEPWKGAPHSDAHFLSPATFVSWEDAFEYCERLSEREKKPYRLPTEAEWEYSCRAGSTTLYSFGNSTKLLSVYAWWGGFESEGNAKYERRPKEVSKTKVNPWGLFDMHGNVAEWCSDWYGKNITPHFH